MLTGADGVASTMFCWRFLWCAGCAELLVLLRAHDIDVYQDIRLECGSRMKKTKHMLVDDVCKVLQLQKMR